VSSQQNSQAICVAVIVRWKKMHCKLQTATPFKPNQTSR